MATETPAGKQPGLAVLERFVSAENAHDIDALAALMADDCRFHGNGTLVAPTWAAYRPIMAATLAAFPDSHREVHLRLAQGDLVAFRWTVTATHQATWNGIPASGRAVTFTGTSWIRVSDDRIAEAWFDMDIAGPIRQMTN